MKTINKTLSLLAFAALPALSGCGTGEASIVASDEVLKATPVSGDLNKKHYERQ